MEILFTLLTLPFALLAGEQWVELALFIGALILVWVVLRLVLGVAARLFRIGCMLIVGLGLVLVALQFLT